MDIYAIIPARYKSSRFEGKPLADINGKPMFWHVYNQACKADLKAVYLATDDIRIEEAAKKYDVPCIMTRDDHESGTDRIFEAASKLNVPNDAVVINIQGDEPLLNPSMINELTAPFSSKTETKVTTLAHKLNTSADKERFLSPNTVKIVLDSNFDALYFSRSPIPYTRDSENTQHSDFYAHIGIYAFRYDILKLFTSLQPSTLEEKEKLEQLRLLENNVQIHVVITKHSSFGVDTPKDLEKAKKLMQSLECN